MSKEKVNSKTTMRETFTIKASELAKLLDIDFAKAKSIHLSSKLSTSFLFLKLEWVYPKEDDDKDIEIIVESNV